MIAVPIGCKVELLLELKILVLDFLIMLHQIKFRRRSLPLLNHQGLLISPLLLDVCDDLSYGKLLGHMFGDRVNDHEVETMMSQCQLGKMGKVGKWETQVRKKRTLDTNLKLKSREV